MRQADMERSHPAGMNIELERLRHDCGEMLRMEDIKASSKLGKSMIYAFWVGVLRADPEKQRAYASLCLMSGRYNDLVT